MNTVIIEGANKSIYSSGLTTQLLVKAAPGKLFSAIISNTGPDQYVQVFDRATSPLSGSVPMFFQVVPAGSTCFVDVSHGLPFVTGICLVNSTTASTYTLGSSDCLFQASYK